MLNALFKRLQDDPTFSKTKEMSNDDESNLFQHAFNVLSTIFNALNNIGRSQFKRF